MEKGKIIKYDEINGVATIVAPLDVYKLVHQEIKECYVDFIDSRSLSDRQRKMCYSLIHSIAEFSGDTVESTKTALKLEFTAEHIETLADKIFSLSNAPMSLVAEFQKYLINFILEYDIPTKFPLLDYVDDIESYVYMCIVHKKCAICGKYADLHHIDTVGMGSDRTQINHIGKEAISLCREHHTEYHTIGKSEFLGKYHLNGGVPIDKTICKIYRLKGV